MKPTVATTHALERMGQKRSDKAWIAEALARDDARFLVLTDLKPVIRSNEARSEAHISWLSRATVEGLGLPVETSLFLGLGEGGVPHFAIAVTDHRARTAPGAIEHLRPAVDLRTLAMQGAMTGEELSLAGQARALAQWHVNAHHCGHCGGVTTQKDGGWRRKCWACGTDWFPRTDPVVIMLITDGERCVLAHEHRYGDKMYSTLAGFIEPGEDIEHAVRRETREETGLTVGEVRYHSSQPWPFPHSLMIGCIGRAETTDITVDTTELAEARWFSREEARAMLERRHPEGLHAPGKHAIAHALILAFVKGWS